MTDINFNITGISDLIQDLKATRCHCNNVACNNNSAWEGRKNILLWPKCLLPSVYMGDDGVCDGNSVKVCSGGGVSFTEEAVEAAVKHVKLLERVVDECRPSVDHHDLSAPLFNDIMQCLGVDEDGE